MYYWILSLMIRLAEKVILESLKKGGLLVGLVTMFLSCFLYCSTFRILLRGKRYQLFEIGNLWLQWCRCHDGGATWCSIFAPWPGALSWDWYPWRWWLLKGFCITSLHFCVYLELFYVSFLHWANDSLYDARVLRGLQNLD